MTSTYTNSLRLNQQGTGDNNNSWGTVLNTDLSLLDAAIAGYATVSVSGGNSILTANNGSTDQSRSAIIEIVGAPTSAVNVVLPAASKTYIVRTSISTSQTVTFKTSTGTGTEVVAGGNCLVITDGTTCTRGAFIGSNSVTSGSYPIANVEINSLGIVVSASQGLSGNGFAVRTATNTYTNRSLSATSGQLAWTNPAGTAGDPIISLVSTAVSAGSYTNPSITVDSFGRITAANQGSSAVYVRSLGRARSNYTSYGAHTTRMILSNSALNTGSGEVILQTSAAPSSAASKIRVAGKLAIYALSATPMVIGLHDPQIGSSYVDICVKNFADGEYDSMDFFFEYDNVNTTSRVLSIYAGPDQSVTWYLNGSPTFTTLGGGNWYSYMAVDEVF